MKASCRDCATTVSFSPIEPLEFWQGVVAGVACFCPLLRHLKKLRTYRIGVARE